MPKQMIWNWCEECETLFVEQYKRGSALLPRLSLSKSYYDHFHNKVLAARHKENLLERMSLEEVKKGLFGSNMKETLLNQDQMQAIHASLKDRKIELKDTSSFQRLVDDILVDEQRRLHASIMKKATEHAAKINQQFKEQVVAVRAARQAKEDGEDGEDSKHSKKLLPPSLTVVKPFSKSASMAGTTAVSKPSSSSTTASNASKAGKRQGQGLSNGSSNNNSSSKRNSLSQSMSGPIVTLKSPPAVFSRQVSIDDIEGGNDHQQQQRLRNLSLMSSPSLSLDDENDELGRKKTEVTKRKQRQDRNKG